MRPLIESVPWHQGPQALTSLFAGEAGVVLLESAMLQSQRGRYSLVTARPFLTFRSFGARCEVGEASGTRVMFGDPWKLLDPLLARCELLDEVDFPFPAWFPILPAPLASPEADIPLELMSSFRMLSSSSRFTLEYRMRTGNRSRFSTV